MVSSVCARAEDVLSKPSSYGLLDPYQLISITPPYQEVVYKELIESLCKSPLVAPNTVAIIEYPEELGCLPFILGNEEFFGIRNRRYGRTVIGMYVYRPSERFDLRAEEFQRL